MSGLLAKVVVGVLKRKAAKSVTSWVGGTLVAAGGATAYNPELVALVPEGWRPYVVMAIGAGVILARHRADIIAAYAQVRAELKAAVDAAERDQASK